MVQCFQERCVSNLQLVLKDVMASAFWVKVGSSFHQRRQRRWRILRVTICLLVKEQQGITHVNTSEAKNACASVFFLTSCEWKYSRLNFQHFYSWTEAFLMQKSCCLGVTNSKQHMRVSTEVNNKWDKANASKNFLLLKHSSTLHSGHFRFHQDSCVFGLKFRWLTAGFIIFHNSVEQNCGGK